jgi:hypothetical protein
MTIIHENMPHDPDSPEAFVFADLLGMFCSVCAPNYWRKDRVELFACATMESDGWLAVDKAAIGLGGSSTPNPCNHAPGKRLHHFLMHNP